MSEPTQNAESDHVLGPWCTCSCGAEHDRRGTGESGVSWFARHLAAVITNPPASTGAEQ